MNRQKIIMNCVSIVGVCSLVAFINYKMNILVIPVQNNMVEIQSNLFTVCSVFAGFGFSILGLVLGLFSERIADKLKGTTLIQRKCNDIVKSIVFFCCSGMISLSFMLGINNFFIKIFEEVDVVNNILYITGIGFLVMGIIRFLFAVRDFLMIIEKIYGLKDTNMKDYSEYEESKSRIRSKRIEAEKNCEDEW